MSKAIANLLNKPEHLVVDLVKKLEDLNGSPSEDVRLLAENLQKLRVKISQLGLDPDDTNSEELYHCLRAKFAKDSDQLDLALNAAGTTVDERAGKAAQLVSNLGGLPEMWLLKHSAAKNLLRQLPPKKLMKQLNYHSAESLLKHENVDNIYLSIAWLESGSWQAAVAKKIAKLSSANFEMRSLHVTSLPEKYYKNTAGPKSHVATDARLGVVALWPANLPTDARVLTLASQLLSSLEKLSGTELSGKFYELSPALRWWADNSQLISGHDGEPVSLNIKDIAHDFLRGHNYANRTNHHGAKALFGALLSRYENQSEKLAETVKSIGYNLSTRDAVDNKAPFAVQLAAEYTEAE